MFSLSEEGTDQCQHLHEHHKGDDKMMEYQAVQQQQNDADDNHNADKTRAGIKQHGALGFEKPSPYVVTFSHVFSPPDRIYLI